MSIIVVLCGLFSSQYASANVIYGPAYPHNTFSMTPFQNFMPPFTFPQLPMPYMPMPFNFPMPNMFSAPIVTRNNFVPEGDTATYVPADPYRGYQQTSTSTSTNDQPLKTQTVINSRINDDDGSATHTVHTSHTSTFKSPGGGSSTHTVLTQTSHTPSTSGSSSSNAGSAHTDVNPVIVQTGGEADMELKPIITGNGGTAETEVRPIITSSGGAAETNKDTSYAYNGGDSHTQYQPNYSTSFVGGGTSHYGSGYGYPSNFGTATYTSSSNINGQGYHETVSSINNNGNVQTYRQTSGY